MKVVINGCFGGFSISPEAALRMYELGAKELATPVDEYYKDSDKFPDDHIFSKVRALRKWREYQKKKTRQSKSDLGLFVTVFSPDEKFVLGTRPDDRESKLLIQVIEELGEKASGACAALRIVEIPDGTEYIIDEYDGNEHIAESHKTWR